MIERKSVWAMGGIAVVAIAGLTIGPYLAASETYDEWLCHTHTRVMTVEKRDGGVPDKILQYAAWYRTEMDGEWYQVCRLNGKELLTDRGYPRKVK